MSQIISSNETKQIQLYLKNIMDNYNYPQLECELRSGLPLREFGGDSNLINLSQFRSLEKFMDDLGLKKTNKTSLDISVKNSTTNPRISDLRFSLFGEDTISEYCKTNTLPQAHQWLKKGKYNKLSNFNNIFQVMYKGSLDWRLEEESDKKVYLEMEKDGYRTRQNKAVVDTVSLRTRFGGKFEMNYDFVEKQFEGDISDENIRRLRENATDAYNDVQKMDFYQLPKIYRLKQRISYEYEIDGMKFSIDLTKVKSSKTDHNRNPIAAINIIDSELSQQDETYEYEIEYSLNGLDKSVNDCYDTVVKFIDNVYIKSLEYIGITEQFTSKLVENDIIKIYRNVVSKMYSNRILNKLDCLRSLKEYNIVKSKGDTSRVEEIEAKYTNPYDYFNVNKNSSIVKIDELMESLSKTLHDVESFRNEFYNNSSFYLSPKVISIDLHNVRNDNPHAITHNYTVTDKADGYNMLLFQVGENDTDNRNYHNKIFMIDSNMIVHSTGLVGKSSTGSYILNGEYLPVDFKSNVLNKYGIFDCYLYDGSDKCMLPLMSEDESVDTRINFSKRYVDMNNELIKKVTHISSTDTKHTVISSGNITKGSEAVLNKPKYSLEEGTIVKVIGIDIDDDSIDYVVKSDKRDGVIIVGKEDLTTKEEYEKSQITQVLDNNKQFGIFVKEFYLGNDEKIFEHSMKIWNDWTSKKVNSSINSRYYLDGLIYTPADYPVGYSKNRNDYDLKQGSGWSHNLKWKPPHDNTIDFLIKFDKDVIAERGSRKVMRNRVIKIPTITDGETIYNEYISAKLFNGGQVRDNKNPCDFKFNKRRNIFEPVAFNPNNPSEENINQILIPVTHVSKNYSIKKIPVDLDGNPIDDNTIVEISYNNFTPGTPDFVSNPSLRWKVLRTRHDKTFNYRLGLNEQKRLQLQINHCINIVNKYDDERSMKKFEFSHIDRNIQRIRKDLQIRGSGTAFEILKQNMTKIENYYKNQSVFKVNINYGNHMDVANNIWRTIHNPITIEMITTGKNIPNISQEEEKYYKREQKRDKSITLGLQDFHNKIVKNKILINNAVGLTKVTEEQRLTLLDLACGKGGDIPKWRDNGIDTVVGIDCVSNNIDDANDGACARYDFYKLQSEKTGNKVPKSYFLVGDAGKSILKGDSVTDTRYSSLQYDLWNTDIHSNTNFTNNKFDMVSVMFATHYFFKSEKILDNFVTNVADNLKPGGIFMGCCFDGNMVFDKLKDKPFNGYIEGIQNGSAIWRIKKKYKNTELKNDRSSIGLTIDVLIYSIGQIIEEYLVNFDVLCEKLEKLNIIPLDEDDLKKINWLPGGKSVGSFQTIYDNMATIPADSPMKKMIKNINLTTQEKELSFLFKYFLFKKKTTEQNTQEQLEKQIYDTSKLRKMLNLPKQNQLRKYLQDNTSYSHDVIDKAIENAYKRYSDEITELRKQQEEEKLKKQTKHIEVVDKLVDSDSESKKTKKKIKIVKGKEIESQSSKTSTKTRKKKSIIVGTSSVLKKIIKMKDQLSKFDKSSKQYTAGRTIILKKIDEFQLKNPDTNVSQLEKIRNEL